jgi:hypothetical protein
MTHQEDRMPDAPGLPDTPESPDTPEAATTGMPRPWWRWLWWPRGTRDEQTTDPGTSDEPTRLDDPDPLDDPDRSDDSDRLDESDRLDDSDRPEGSDRSDGSNQFVGLDRLAVPGRSGAPGGGPGPIAVAAGPAEAREVFERARRDGAAAFEAVMERAGERDRLVEVCVDLADRLRVHHAGLWALLREGLAGAGVTLTVVDGERFDATRHRAIGREPAGDPASHLTVARTQLCGVTDRGREIRIPEVVVYMEEGRSDAG